MIFRRNDSPLDERDLGAFAANDPRASGRVRALVVRLIRFRGFTLVPADREDVVQETMTELWRAVSAPSFRCQNFEGLVRTIAYRRCIDALRRRRRVEPLDLELADPGSGPESDLLEGERAELGQQVLQLLRPPCRELIRLHAVEELSYREIAQSQGRSEAALRSQMCQCLREARAALVASQRPASRERKDRS